MIIIETSILKYIITDDGALPGASEALRDNILKYPTYKDLHREHTEHFKVKEKIKRLFGDYEPK